MTKAAPPTKCRRPGCADNPPHCWRPPPGCGVSIPPPWAGRYCQRCRKSPPHQTPARWAIQRGDGPVCCARHAGPAQQARGQERRAQGRHTPPHAAVRGRRPAPAPMRPAVGRMSPKPPPRHPAKYVPLVLPSAADSPAPTPRLLRAQQSWPRRSPPASQGTPPHAHHAPAPKPADLPRSAPPGEKNQHMPDAAPPPSKPHGQASRQRPGQVTRAAKRGAPPL